MIPTHKQCTKCKEEKSLDLFSKGQGKFKKASWCHKCNAEARPKYSHEYYMAHKTETWSRSLKTRYKLSVEDYYTRLLNQGGVCALCLKPPVENEKLQVDHDHTCCPQSSKSCGKCIRGLLHRHCNTALGLLSDNPVVLRLAATYLEKHP